MSGLSPRVRGNLEGIPLEGKYIGSIPACAGEPGYGNSQSRRGSVYPRVCGGTWCGDECWAAGVGLSPRVRGNHRAVRFPVRPDGSIPACAGEPIPHIPGAESIRVYPRVCGGTISSMREIPCISGLSPRVRGNPRESDLSIEQLRSIPACAGEPGDLPGRTRPARVYPRVCGGTSSPSFIMWIG